MATGSWTGKRFWDKTGSPIFVGLPFIGVGIDELAQATATTTRDIQNFDAVDGGSSNSISLTSDLPFGGSAHLVLDNKGNFSINTHAHDSGFDNINYTLGGVLMTPSGLAFTFTVQGSVEGTEAGLPFGTPQRSDDQTESGSNPSLKDEFERIRGSIFVGKLAGTDTLVDGVKGLVGDALKSAAGKFGAEGAAAVIALLKCQRLTLNGTALIENESILRPSEIALVLAGPLR
jgi:hypothetical protein